MTSPHLKRATLATAVIAGGFFSPIEWQQGGGVTLSVDTARARVGPTIDTRECRRRGTAHDANLSIRLVRVR
jgi:hypothetical protein